MHSGKPEVVLINEDGVIDLQFLPEKFLQGHMKIVQKPRIIDNAGMIDITEANFKL
jgi:hypothetical protein